jgi:hypothetical protein
MRFEISLVSLVLAGCASVAPGLSARENCGVAYQIEMGWREIRAPKERQQLLELAARSEDLTKAKQRLTVREGQREAWFRSRDGRVLICVDTPDKDTCDQGSARTTEFTRKGSSWVAGPTYDVECVVVTS